MGEQVVMFKILEVDSKPLAPPIEIGGRFATREDALAAVRRHLKLFKASGHNPEGGYWWARDAKGLRKCWISADGGSVRDAVNI